MLEIGVYRHHGVAGGVAVAGGCGGFFAKVTRKVDDLHGVRIGFFEVFCYFEGGVGTAVVDEEYFIVVWEWGKGGFDFFEKMGKVFGFIKSRYDNTDE